MLISGPARAFLAELTGGRAPHLTVKISGDGVRNFFVGITPTQNARRGVKLLIQIWCEQHRDKWPKDGETIPIDLDEVRVAGQARSVQAR